MAEESNGHNSASRIDRIERAIEALIDGHERLRVSQKELLGAQVIMYELQEKTASKLEKLVDTVQRLAEKVDSHEDSIQALVDSQLRVDRVLERIQKLLEQRPAAGS